MNTQQQTNNQINLINMNGDNYTIDKDDLSDNLGIDPDEGHFISIEDIKTELSEQLEININLISLFIEGEEDEPKEQDEADKDNYYILINNDMCKDKIEKMLYRLVKDDYLNDKDIGICNSLESLNRLYNGVCCIARYSDHFNIEYLEEGTDDYEGCDNWISLMGIIDDYKITDELLTTMIN
tara:strand:- start:690 stop:1235 length:546 start_codon:yes stop_codon:yes gene_type:complete